MSDIERIKALLAAEVSRPIKDQAGIIIPAHLDAHHRAAGMRRIIQELEAGRDASRPAQSR